MHIYFIGIGGAGLSALAHMALDAGWHVSGSDVSSSNNTLRLRDRGANVVTPHDAQFLLNQHQAQPITMVVQSAAIADDNPELQAARELKLKIGKRHHALHNLIAEHQTKVLAVAGTHGKTTTTAMAAWLFTKLDKPVSWFIGSNIPFGNSGSFKLSARWLVLEADEYDRHMLHYHPDITIIPSLDYDHADIYPTQREYNDAFRQLIGQSQQSYGWLDTAQQLELTAEHNFKAVEKPLLTAADVQILGAHNRANAELLAIALGPVLGEPIDSLLTILEDFPGTERRLETLEPHLLSDYAHHPTEIIASLQAIRESTPTQQIVVVYQPHLNERQQEIIHLYQSAFNEADKVYWLPTYEPPGRTAVQKPLTQQQLIDCLGHSEKAQPAELNPSLLKTIEQHLHQGDVVVIMGAGDIDPYVRDHFRSR